MSWSDERVATLKKLWLDGLSASQIAKQLGGVTRNAVIGKVHRLGLSGRAAPSQPTRPLFKPTRPRPAVAASPAPAPAAAPRRAETQIPVRAAAPSAQVPALAPDLHGTATVLTLGAHMCKWPIGDPTSSEFSFCGRRAGDGTPYCIEHARVAYQPQQKKKREGGTDLARSLRRYL